jgi:multidrug efflux pump subunit AcrB
VFDKLIQFYQKTLSFCLNKKLIFVLLALIIAASGYWLFKSVPKAFTPNDDQGLVIAFMKSSKEVSPTYLRPLIQKAQTVIDDNPNVANSMAVAWASGSFNAIFIQLNPLSKRKLSSTDVATQLNKTLKTIPGLNMRAFASSFGDRGHTQLSWMLQTTESYKKLAKTSDHMVEELNKYPGLAMITNDLSYDSAEYKVNINRNLANALGVSISQIDQVIASFVGGNKVTTLNQSTTSYDVYVQAQRNMIADPLQIESLLLNVTENGKSKQIPLSDLITIKRVASQDKLSHYNHLRSAEFSAQLSPGYTLGQVVSYLQTALPKLLPGNIQFSFKGKAKHILDSSHNMNFIFILAFIFIYLVLSALFESFVDPFIILLVVPLSIVAALAALKLAGGTLNIYTNIGLVTLVGLIAKHGILITQFSNRCLAQGTSVKEALLDAGAQRLRPILMTTAAMIFGAIPLVFAGGSSAESRFQIGLVIIAGLFFGTFFSLIIVPIVYALCKRQKSIITI